jgi:hypothetical protein
MRKYRMELLVQARKMRTTLRGRPVQQTKYAVAYN